MLLQASGRMNCSDLEEHEAAPMESEDLANVESDSVDQAIGLSSEDEVEDLRVFYLQARVALQTATRDLHDVYRKAATKPCILSGPKLSQTPPHLVMRE